MDMACENPAARMTYAQLEDPERTYPDACNDAAKAIPECFVAENWNYGWICDATSKIFENLGLTVEASTKANFTQASKDLYTGGSSYTRCIYEIIAGNQDICVSDYWQTAERASIISFTTGVDQDTQVLVTMPIGGASALEDKPFSLKDITGQNIMGIVRPFESAVWGVTAGFFIFGGLLLWLIEGIGQGNEDYIEVYENRNYAVAAGTIKSIYGSVIDYWLAGASFLTSTSWPGRIAVLGYSFFIFITGTSYTGALYKSIYLSMRVCVCMCVYRTQNVCNL